MANKGQLHIVIVATTDLVFDQRVAKFAASLHKANYQVTVLGRLKTKSPKLGPTLYNQERIENLAESGKLFYYQFNQAAYKRLLELKPNCIICVDADTIIGCSRAAKKLSVKLILDAHELFSEVPEVINRPLVQFIWKYIEKKYYRKADAHITVSKSVAEEYEKRLGISFSVIRNVPYKTTYHVNPDIDKKPFIILYQGALNAGRKLEVLIDAMDNLDDCECWLIGEGDLSKQLREQAAQNEFPERIKFWGYLSPTRLKEITPKAHLGYNLLDAKSLSYQCSLANKTFDYIQAGVLGLHSPLPEYKRLFEQYKVGFFHDLNSEKTLDEQAKSLALRIKEIKKDQSEFARLGLNCIQAASDLHWENEEQLLLDLVDQLMTSSSYNA